MDFTEAVWLSMEHEKRITLPLGLDIEGGET
jgi:hypothetical protein